MFVYKDVTKCHSFGEGVLKKFFYGVKMPFFARGGQKNLQIPSISKKNGIAYLFTDFFVWGGQRVDDGAFRVKRGRRVNFYKGYSEKCHPGNLLWGGRNSLWGGAPPPIMGGAYTYGT